MNVSHLSLETETTLRRLLTEQPTYKPVAAVLEKLQYISFSCFVGATCMGKTTLMDALVAFRPDFYGKTRNFTTRPPREDDDPRRYYYYEHTDAGLAEILAKIDAHKNLQHNINPYTLTMYGSEVGDYPHPMNVGDIFASSIDGFRQLGFGKLYIFSVVTEPEAWLARIEERFPVGHPSRQARLQEAADSLTWSLAQTAPDHAWVINPPNDIQVAVASVDSTIRGEISHDQPEARRLAEQCLKKVTELLK